MAKIDMKQAFHLIPAGNDDLSEVNVIIEIAKGSLIKYEYDKELGIVKVDRYLFQPTPFFYDYGLIPQTWMSGDDDPLDAIVLTNTPGYPGTLVTVRPIGIICVNDSGETDDKIISVPLKDPRWSDVKSYKDLPEHFRKELQFFIEHYTALQPNKVIKVTGWKSPVDAKRLIKESIEEYKRRFSTNR